MVTTDAPADEEADADLGNLEELPPERSRVRRRPAVAVVVGLVVLTALIVLGAGGLGFATGWTKAAGGEVIVVRNGGFLDDNSFRQVIQPNSELTYTGLGASTILIPPRSATSRSAPPRTPTATR